MQYLALSLLLALGAGALPQAPNPANFNLDKRGDDPVIGFFNDENCLGKHIGSEVPMTTNCTKFQPAGTYKTIKISWHHGPGKVMFFLNDYCVEDHEYNGLMTRKNEQHEWDCWNANDFYGVGSMMVPQ